MTFGTTPTALRGEILWPAPFVLAAFTPFFDATGQILAPLMRDCRPRSACQHIGAVFPGRVYTKGFSACRVLPRQLD